MTFEESKEYLVDLVESTRFEKEPYEIAIEAIGKQIPMKPKAVLSANGKKLYECSNCGNELSSDPFDGDYCKWCGQKTNLRKID